MRIAISSKPDAEWFRQFFTAFWRAAFQDEPESTELIGFLSDNASLQHVRKKEKLIERGTPQSFMYFLVSGGFRCYTQKDDGKELTNNFMLTPGEPFIAATSIRDGDAAVDTVQAVEESELVLLPLKALNAAAARFPEVNDTIVKGMGMSFQRYLDIIRIRSFSAEERCRWMHVNHPELEKRVQKQYIASYLDMDKAMYSRCMKAVLTKEQKESAEGNS